MFNSWTLTDGEFIDGKPISITPERGNWNSNSSQFERNEDAYMDVYGRIDDIDFMRDEWNQEYDPLADIEFKKAMYTDFIFTGPFVM